MPNRNIVHNPKAQRFEYEADGHLAELDYYLSGGHIVFTHTGVPPAIEGRGIGGELVQTGLDYAREHGLVVVPQCPFVYQYIQEHPEYQDLTQPPATGHLPE